MQIANVIGRATSTLKHESLIGAKLSIVQPIGVNGTPDGFPLIAVDTVGAGNGDRVFITSDGTFGRTWLGNDTTPVRWTIVGIED